MVWYCFLLTKKHSINLRFLRRPTGSTAACFPMASSCAQNCLPENGRPAQNPLPENKGSARNLSLSRSQKRRPRIACPKKMLFFNEIQMLCPKLAGSQSDECFTLSTPNVIPENGKGQKVMKVLHFLHLCTPVVPQTCSARNWNRRVFNQCFTLSAHRSVVKMCCPKLGSADMFCLKMKKGLFPN